MKESIKKQVQKLPDAPGIYFFYTKEKELVYVGKATSLKSRIRSYFSGKRNSRPIEQMIDVVETIKVKQTDTVLESMIAEANAISTYLPKYNVDGKDNKSWNYIIITKEDFPKVQTMRSHELDQIEEAARKKQFLYLFGPYPKMNTKATLNILRQLFYFTNCKVKSSRPCLYYQMGKCIGVCTGEITPKEYKKQVIMPLVQFLRGGKKRLITALKKQMEEASKTEDFERAAQLRNMMGRLLYIHDMALINTSFFVDDEGAPGREQSKKLFGTSELRIEGYDISNLGSSGKVGSMVVFNSLEAQKKHYRIFHIKTVKGQSDVDCLEEVIRRRLKHSEWPLPQVFLIDGGKPQINTVQRVFDELGVQTLIVGIAKGSERKKNEFHVTKKMSEFITWVSLHEKLLIQVRDEAHRFALKHQKKRRTL